MYLARIDESNPVPKIYEIDDFEATITSKGKHKKIITYPRRAPWSWISMSFGNRCAAAIANSPATAIAAAKVKLGIL